MPKTAPRAQQPFTLRSLILSVYLPTFFFSVGEGAVLPIIPLFARERGASAAAAPALVALGVVGASRGGWVGVPAALLLGVGGGWPFWRLPRLAYVSEVTP